MLIRESVKLKDALSQPTNSRGVKLHKNLVGYLALIVVFLVIVSAFTAIKLAPNTSDPFYVGVTYCGDSVLEAKQLIDHVKNYTNLFVLQSGSLMDIEGITEIGDYAVNAGLKFMSYFGDSHGPATTANTLIRYAENRWNNSFLGLYYNDEPGGKMLDKKGLTLGSVFRNPDGSVAVSQAANQSNQTFITFQRSGEIDVSETLSFEQSNITTEKLDDRLITCSKTTIYQPNGTITYTEQNIYRPNATSDDQIDPSPVSTDNQLDEGPVSTHLPWNSIIIGPDPYQTITVGPFTYQPDGIVQDQNGNLVTNQGNISRFEAYEQLWGSNPLGTYAKTASTFVNSQSLNDVKKQSDTTIFTSDYALYWFDYQSGYGTVLDQFVGNESRQVSIALCRGAAETLGKDWGVIITWKYNQAPYLESGDELFNDLTLAYSSGAKYSIVFSYPNITAYGTLKEEHFEALQKFWVTLHTNPQRLLETQSRVAYVVPADCGFGFRNANDSVWGQFPADSSFQKINYDTQTLIGKYGASLNILYDGPETKAKLPIYTAVYYYNQTIT